MKKFDPSLLPAHLRPVPISDTERGEDIMQKLLAGGAVKLNLGKGGSLEDVLKVIQSLVVPPSYVTESHIIVDSERLVITKNIVDGDSPMMLAFDPSVITTLDHKTMLNRKTDDIFDDIDKWLLQPSFQAIGYDLIRAQVMDNPDVKCCCVLWSHYKSTDVRHLAVMFDNGYQRSMTVKEDLTPIADGLVGLDMADIQTRLAAMGVDFDQGPASEEEGDETI